MNQLQIFVVILFFIIKKTNGQIGCTTDKYEIPVIPPRTILSHQCFSGTSYYIIPIDNGSNQREYNELDLSPNLYNVVPVDQLCPFTNIYLLDMSFNRLTNLTNIFKQLSCLVSLRILDLSNNRITTPILASDFEDTLPSQLVSLKLNNNRIPSIESAVFVKSNGDSRFPSLELLDLSNNLIRVFDLLWPMTIPSIELTIKLNNNQINNITNQLKMSFDEPLFTPMIDRRRVDLTNNQIIRLDDTNLLQYGPNSPDSFREFLYKLSNYDFGQNRSNFICNCPTGIGSYSVLFYRNISARITDKTAPIYRLFCSSPINVYIFEFPCTFIGTTSTTTTTTTVTTRTTTTSTTTTTTKQPTTTSSTTIITSTTTSTTTQTVNINSIGQLLNSNSTSSTTTTQNDNLYFLLLLLLIPLILLLVLLFLCCCGRWFSVCCFGCCSTRLCQCAQPDKKTIFKDDAEINDISILYNENNQMWVDKNFVPNLRNAKRDLKINKINKPSDLTPDNKTQISNSRRIALIFTKKFIQNEWQNQELKNFLKEINPERIIIAICVGDLTRKQIKQYLRQIESDHVKKNIFTRFANCAKSRIKYNTSLNNLEIVDYHSTEFWNRFNYILPIDRVEGPDGIIDESKYNKIKEEASEKGAVKPERSQSSISVENEVPLLNKLKKSIEANRVSPENTPRQVQDNLIINMDDFWTPYMAKSPGDYNYEPVAVAGTPNKGNKESNLKRFGVNLPPVNDKNLGSKKLQKITSNLREEGKEDMNDKSGRIQVPNALINNFIERTKEPALKETDNPEKNNFKLNKKSSLRDPPKIESESGSNDRDEEEKKLPKLKKKVVIETELNSLAHYPIHLNENSNDESVDKKKKKRKSKKKSSNNDDDDDNSKSNDQ